MALVVSYDDKSGMPSSEIALRSGEHVLLSLDQNGLVITLLARPGNAEGVLFKASAKTVAQICAGLFDDQGQSKATPLQILVAAVTQMPNSAAVKTTFESAEAALSSGHATKMNFGKFLSRTAKAFLIAPLWVPIVFLS